MSLPLHLRSYREKSKEETTRDFFNVPLPDQLPGPSDPPSVVKLRNVTPVWGQGKDEKGSQGMDINAVLSVEGKEEVYVSVRGRRRHWNVLILQAGRLSLLPPFLCFISLDRKSCRCTLPLYTIRRVERYVSRRLPRDTLMGRLNSRAGVFALSLATWHGMRIVGIVGASPKLCDNTANKQDPSIDLTATHRRALFHPPARCLEVSGKSNRFHRHAFKSG